MLEPDMKAPGVQRVSVRGRKLAVQIRGAGPLVVLEMGGGFGGIGPYWGGVDVELAKFCRVLVYDRAGLGRSDRVRGLPTMGERAQDLAALLDALDIREPALFVGWSLGGLVVQNFAARYPQRVGGLLLVDPTPPDMFEQHGPLGRWVFSALLRTVNQIQLWSSLWGAFKTQAARQKLRERAATQWGPHMPPDYGELVVDAMAQPPLYRALILETNTLPRLCHETLQLLAKRGLPRAPAILLAATHPTPPNGDKRSAMYKWLLELAPEMEMRELPEIGHMIAAEAPDRVIQAAHDVLARMAATRQRDQAGGFPAGSTR
jgi:pimeloyl-ACP methyl ester carboxylesterase